MEGLVYMLMIGLVIAYPLYKVYCWSLGLTKELEKDWSKPKEQKINTSYKKQDNSTYKKQYNTTYKTHKKRYANTSIFDILLLIIKIPIAICIFPLAAFLTIVCFFTPKELAEISMLDDLVELILMFYKGIFDTIFGEE